MVYLLPPYKSLGTSVPRSRVITSERDAHEFGSAMCSM